MVLEKQFISAEDFVKIVEQPDYDNRNVELVEGEIVDMPFPNPIHAAVLASLAGELIVFVKESKSGRVLVGDAPFVLKRNAEGRDTLRGLDIAYISADRLPGKLPRSPLRVAPDLAVEIISPSNKAGDIEKKIQQLLNAGTSLIWIVYPDLRTVTIHTVDGATTLTVTDTLTGGDILPGFEVRVADIFPS
ncbi:MAG: Uma2 family endonuclease [Chloroflexi bacterium]|nr:Uma2 family endonuclease [Chloroflexota bacterium]